MREIIQKVISFTVNGEEYILPVGDEMDCVSPSETLAFTLRERLGLTGLKIGCGQGACGCCTVIVDNKAITSCIALTVEYDGKVITTIEGLANRATGELTGLQKSFIDNCGYQCGFCTSGIIMTAEALLRENPQPTEEEIREALAGNYCRCGTHYTAVDSIMAFVNGGEKDE